MRKLIWLVRPWHFTYYRRTVVRMALKSFLDQSQESGLNDSLLALKQVKEVFGGALPAKVMTEPR